MTNPCASYRDEDGCIVTPECPAVPMVPSVRRSTPVLGWNAGADSLQILDGDVFCRFDAPTDVTGVRIGFKQTRYRQTMPDLITHGFYLQRALTGFFQVMEGGAARTALVPYGDHDVFELRRVAGQVTYWRNGAQVYASQTPFTGPVLINACLYATNDWLPSGPPQPPPDAGSPWWYNNTSGQGSVAPTLGEPWDIYASTNPDRTDYLLPYYWSIEIPDGAMSMDVSLTDNANGDFAAAGGWVGIYQSESPDFFAPNYVGYMTDQGGGFYNVNGIIVDQGMSLYYSIALYANTSIEDLTLTVTLT